MFWNTLDKELERRYELLRMEIMRLNERYKEIAIELDQRIYELKQENKELRKEIKKLKKK